MKKINYLFTLLAALMISGNMWATVLTVGSGKTYSSVSAAISAAQAGDSILVFNNVSGGFTIGKNVIIKGAADNVTISSCITINSSCTIENLTITDGTDASVIIGSSSLYGANIVMNNVILNGKKRGIKPGNPSYQKGFTLTLNNSLVQCTSRSHTYTPEYDYNKDYLNGSKDIVDGRGISLWIADGSILSLNNTTIQGFAYSVFIGGGALTQPASIYANKSTFKGRAALYCYDGHQYNSTFTDCSVTGISNEGGNTEKFACFVLGGKYNSLTINGGTFITVSFNGAGVQNVTAQQYLVGDRGSVNTITINNAQYSCPRDLGSTQAQKDIKGGIIELLNNNSSLTINGGVYECPILTGLVTGGRINIHGGKYTMNAIPSSFEGTALLGTLMGQVYYSPSDPKYIGNVKHFLCYQAAGRTYIYGGTFNIDPSIVFTYTEEEQQAFFGTTYAPTSVSLIADGYKAITNADGSYTVVPITTEEKEPAVSKTTVDWNTQADWKDGEVPTENSNIQVANGTTVTLAANEEGTANYINLADDAILVVKSGANLTVGDEDNQGVAVIVADNTSKIIVENDGQLVLNGLVQGTDNIEVYAEEGSETALLIKPDVNVYGDENPVGHFFFTSKAKYENSKYTWQRFGVPTANGEVNVTWKNADGSAATSKTAIYEYDYAADDWKYLAANTSGNLTFSTPFTPFQCYDMTINENKPGTVYNFTGSFMGNQNAKFTLVNGWNYLANSYLAPIDLKSFLSDVKDQYGDVAATAYIYRSSDNYWDHVSLADFEGTFGEGPAQTKISPMQAFILQLTKGNGVEAGINYEDNVYDPIVNPAPSAPARKMAKADIESANIRVSNGSFSSKVRLAASNEFTADFDNGFDSYIYEQGDFSIYALAENGHMADLATDNLENVELAFVAKTTGTYTLTMSNVNGEYILRDLANNAIVRMTEGATYTFAANANETAARFRVESARNMPTSIDETQVTNKQAGVYSINGLYLGEAAAIANMPAGVYIVNGVKIVK